MGKADFFFFELWFKDKISFSLFLFLKTVFSFRTKWCIYYNGWQTYIDIYNIHSLH